MTCCSYIRGHKIIYEEDDKDWKYADTGNYVIDEDERPCKKCGKTFMGSDPCLGNLPGVDNACCGHGVKEYSYIRFKNGLVINRFDIS